jgi:hypothetical protein
LEKWIRSMLPGQVLNLVRSAQLIITIRNLTEDLTHPETEPAKVGIIESSPESDKDD